MVGVPEILLMGLMLVLPVGCLANWLAFIRSRHAAEPFIRSEYRRSVPWGIIDMGVVIVLVALIAGFGVGIVRSRAGIQASELTELSPSEQALVFGSFGVASLIATALSLGWLYLRFGKHEAIGFDSAHLGRDIELGLRWFLMLIVPVVLLQLLLTRWFPTKHPLIEMLRQSGSLRLLPVAAFTAAVSAPLFEEVFFRLLFQGWLEKLHITMQRTRAGLAGRAERDAVIFGGESESTWSPPLPPTEQQANEPLEHAAVDDEGSPYVGPRSDFNHVGLTSEVPIEPDRPILWTPILLSSALFSLAHFSHGPDWIPLFFLALGLGVLYQRTRRIQACIVVHFLVNALGVLQLWSAIRQF